MWFYNDQFQNIQDNFRLFLTRNAFLGGTLKLMSFINNYYTGCTMYKNVIQIKHFHQIISIKCSLDVSGAQRETETKEGGGPLNHRTILNAALTLCGRKSFEKVVLFLLLFQICFVAYKFKALWTITHTQQLKGIFLKTVRTSRKCFYNVRIFLFVQRQMKGNICNPHELINSENKYTYYRGNKLSCGFAGCLFVVPRLTLSCPHLVQKAEVRCNHGTQLRRSNYKSNKIKSNGLKSSSAIKVK